MTTATPPPTSQRVCKDCGDVYLLGSRTQEYFLARGLSLPVRCKACRKKRSAGRGPIDVLTGHVTRVIEDGGGYGFIAADDGRVFFFRLNRVAPGDLPLRRGDVVTFEASGEAPLTGLRPHAFAIRLVS